MICKKVLLGVALISAVATGCGQDVVSQKIKQLKEARLQKAQELSELGEKITKKDQFVAAIASGMNAAVESYCKDFSAAKKEEFIKMYGSWTDSFMDKLVLAIHKNISIKGFLCEECIDNIEKTIGSFKVRDLEILKVMLIRFYNELALRNMLIEQYEDILQQVIELDNELCMVTNKSAFPK